MYWYITAIQIQHWKKTLMNLMISFSNSVLICEMITYDISCSLTPPPFYAMPNGNYKCDWNQQVHTEKENQAISWTTRIQVSIPVNMPGVISCSSTHFLTQVFKGTGKSSFHRTKAWLNLRKFINIWHLLSMFRLVSSLIESRHRRGIFVSAREWLS